MRILIVGNGGREHTLLWKLRQDAPAAELHITRGNGGTDGLAQPLPLDPTDIAALAGWAEAHQADLTIIGPEAPLADGIADVFLDRGLPLFGPTKGATAIESSKSYAKDLMRRAGVPTAQYESFTDPADCEAYIRAHGGPLVVKASGLAAGKGAVVCPTTDEALAAARAMLVEGAFGAAGAEVVVEELLVGEELSVFGLTDGSAVLPMLPAQDYKRAGEGDSGPNTGGMGAYAPVGLVDPPLLRRVREEILLPTLRALADEGHAFRGLLYAGLMLTADGPKVIEFNARFGDPETQALLPLLRSSLLEPMLAIARGLALTTDALEWRGGAALTTVLAAGGYPGSYENGKPISIPAWIGEADDVLVFHAGTRGVDGRLVTAGGRVLAVTGVGADVAAAAARSRAAAEAIEFEGKHFRRDIGWRELDRHAGAA